MTVTVARCATCRRSFHPPPPSCPSCRGAVHPHEHTGEGTVVSWTQVDRPPTGFAAPQRVLLVQLDTEPDDAIGPLVLATTADDALLQTGARVHLTPQDALLTARAGT